jgi:hypothetical protein
MNSWISVIGRVYATMIWVFAAALFVISMHMCPTPSWVDASQGNDGLILGQSACIAAIGSYVYGITRNYGK